MARFQLENSDVITFHCYGPPDEMKKRIESLSRFKRPIICTEYMARPLGSTFASILSVLKGNHVGAYNWGFVNGKAQTIYSWVSWEKAYSSEPKPWFHDIFRKDGTPYDRAETALIKKLTEGDSSAKSGQRARESRQESPMKDPREDRQDCWVCQWA